MADIKLFKLAGTQLTELAGASVSLEKSLQTLIEKNLEVLLGVRFLSSEHVTGKTHGGRIDTLGIDENGSPVIIEYKRSLNENVINQGLFYLDWLMDHKADFKLLVMERLGPQAADDIDWLQPRLLCIAGDFTRYDEHAVQQINRNIELVRYRRFEDQLLLFELVNATAAMPGGETVVIPGGKAHRSPTQLLTDADQQIKDVFEGLRTFLLSLGDDVQLKELRHYFAFKRLKNFASVEVHSKRLKVFLKVPPSEVVMEKGFTRDVSKMGHWGTGDLEVTMDTLAHLEKAKPLALRSYERN